MRGVTDERPLLRVVTAAWPSDREPQRARFLEELHSAIAPRFRSEVLAPHVHPEDPVHETRGANSIRRFPSPVRGRTIRSSAIGPVSAARYILSARREALRWWGSSRALGGGVLGHWIVPTGWVAARVAARLDLPLILYAHGSDVHRYGRRGIGRVILRRTLQRADLVLTASEALATSIRPHCRPSTRVVVSPVGIADVFHDRGDPPATPPLRLLFVGDRLVSKGADVVEEAIGRAAARGVEIELEWVGATGDLGPVPRHGTLLGELPPEEVAGAMSRAHLLLLPSRAEGTPVVLQEAIAARLPWAATPVGGIPALFERYPGGTLLPGPEDREACIDAIVALCTRFHSEGAQGVRERRNGMSTDVEELRTRRRAVVVGDEIARALEVGRVA